MRSLTSVRDHPDANMTAPGAAETNLA
jgi:hypothetical protein